MDIAQLTQQLQSHSPEQILDPQAIRLLFALSTSWKSKLHLKNRVTTFLTGFAFQGQSQPLASNGSVAYDDAHFLADLDQQLAAQHLPQTLTLTDKNLLNGLHFTDDISVLNQLVAAGAGTTLTLQSQTEISLSN